MWIDVLTAVAVVAAIGLALGVLTHISTVMKALFEPLLHIIKATPVASFIVLALVLMSWRRD